MVRGTWENGGCIYAVCIFLWKNTNLLFCITFLVSHLLNQSTFRQTQREWAAGKTVFARAICLLLMCCSCEAEADQSSSLQLRAAPLLQISPECISIFVESKKNKTRCILENETWRKSLNFTNIRFCRSVQFNLF